MFLCYYDLLKVFKLIKKILNILMKADQTSSGLKKRQACLKLTLIRSYLVLLNSFYVHSIKIKTQGQSFK